ncbi:MAG TPA: response regulator transcription factor, partial [Ilumatobacteraceae bacterium]|nr:response regulator transcription factor [Ilumatobacteraceae bacterium]
TRLKDEIEHGAWQSNAGFAAGQVIEEAEPETDALIEWVGALLTHMDGSGETRPLELTTGAVALLADRLFELPPQERDAQRALWLPIARDWVARADRLEASLPVHDELMARLEQLELGRLAGDPDPDGWAGVAAVLRAIELPYYEARARWRAAEAHLVGTGGRTVAAHELAAEQAEQALTICRAIGAVRLAERIERLQQDAHLVTAGPASPVSAPPAQVDSFGLTSREREILTLVAAGLSNGEIGSRLFISTKTASVHVSNILRKLGVSNRVEAAIAAQRHGLLLDDA